MSEKIYYSQEQIEEYLRKLEEYDEKEELKVDMHNHTTGSDGEDSPLKLLLRAHRMGLKTISITDHNNVVGYELLKKQIEKVISNLEELDNRDDLPEAEKEKMRRGAKRLLKVIEEVDIITGCEVCTVFKAQPYVEILAYGVDIEKLDKILTEANKKKKVNKGLEDKGLEDEGNVLCDGFMRIAQQYGFESDLFFVKERNNYKKLFFHELKKHPENEFLYKEFEGKIAEEVEETEEEKAEEVEETEEEKAEAAEANAFAKHYFSEKGTKYYVNLEEKSTRKKEMLEMVQRMKKDYPELVFDEKIIKNAGAASAQFYNELLKHPEDMEKIKSIDNRIDSLKKLIYLGIYNEKSPLFIDLSKTKPSPEIVIKAIHDAGGKALVAHWGRYLSSNREVFDWRTEEGKRNLKELIEMCDGAECAYPDNPMELRRLIYNLCKMCKKEKFISIGGDNHGKSGKEGKQYQLGSQNGREVTELEWIKESVISGKDFLRQLEEEHQYRARLKRIIEKNKEKIQKNPTKDKQTDLKYEQGE